MGPMPFSRRALSAVRRKIDRSRGKSGEGKAEDGRSRSLAIWTNKERIRGGGFDSIALDVAGAARALECKANETRSREGGNGRNKGVLLGHRQPRSHLAGAAHCG
ncbi:hypothetical protein KM043_000947 [Ampulex compressa]|nr:hypothetical protein KM043_000947 [Ampulex compressa]